MNENAIKQNKAIQELTYETMKKAKRLGCCIRINPETGYMEWSKQKEVDMSNFVEGRVEDGRRNKGTKKED